MIVYRDATADIALIHPFSGDLVANVYRSNVLIGEANRTVTSISDYHSITINYQETEFDGEIVVVWSGENFVRKTLINVVTPIVPFTRLLTVFPDRDGDEEFFNELEASIRLIIESYTGTKFEYFKGSIKVQSTNSALMLPTRAINIDYIPGLPSYRISPNGRIILGMNEQYLTIKQAPPEEFSYVSNGVITVPNYYRRIRSGSIYEIVGEFGYLDVPEDVQEAAMLLANDFACNDGIYTDKYISTVKTELTNYIFDSRAFSGTGNARVDLLLSKYKAEGYAWL